jgi:hypothetical protein
LKKKEADRSRNLSRGPAERRIGCSPEDPEDKKTDGTSPRNNNPDQGSTAEITVEELNSTTGADQKLFMTSRISIRHAVFPNSSVGELATVSRHLYARCKLSSAISRRDDMQP